MFFIVTYLTDKFEYSYINCKSALDYLYWAFYFLGQYKYVDQYVNNRMNKAKSYINEAREYEKNGYSYLAEESIKKYLNEVKMEKI